MSNVWKKKNKDKKEKKIEPVVAEVKVEEPKPKPPPKPKFVPWRTAQVASTQDIITLFNDLESQGLDIIEYDFEYNHRMGLIDIVYKVKKVV